MDKRTENTSVRNKRIAKNTLLLYVRTIFVMIVSLYTSRVVLSVLGIDDYGIYNVIGGTIAMLSIFSSSISSSISRYITFGLGKADLDRLKIIFSTSVNIQVILAITITIFGEIIGLWLLNNQLKIPADRYNAAHWVFQFSLLSFIVGMINIPYNACIIAHEKMNVFAYMSIIEVSLKLGQAFLLFWIDVDKLILYSVMTFFVSLVLRIIYVLYCRRNFEECQYRPITDKHLLKEMSTFAFWGFFGNAGYMFSTQGVNILMNIFFGVVINAARGVVAQAEGAVIQFVYNFTTAISPQITKSFAEGSYEYMYSLICRGAKFSFILTLLFLIPLFIESETILNIWLGKVPEYAPIFLRYSLCCSAIIVIGNSGLTAIMATGKISKYQFVATILSCSVFPLSWLAYKLGLSVVTSYIIFLIIYTLLDVIRLMFLRYLVGFKIHMFVRNVIKPIGCVTTLSLIIPLTIYALVDQSILRLILIFLSSTISVGVSGYFFGLNHTERRLISSNIRARLGFQ